MKNFVEETDGNLLRMFEDPELIESLDVEGLGGQRTEKLLENLENWEIDRAIERLREKRISLISAVDEAYPQRLFDIYDPPPVLFYRGDLSSLDASRLGVVGTRKGSELGKTFTQDLARRLSELGVTVVSGLASGIDAAAHRGALNGSEASTVAVLGNGVDIAYPSRNRELQHDIEENGLLVSEYPPGTKPDGRHFPQRNRIISGLSSGVLVVQAGVRSGAIITADFALEQGREVYAVPGSVNDDLHKGCHRLIKEGAGLVESAEDIIDYLQVSGQFSPADQSVTISSEAKSLFDLIQSRPVHLDELAEESGLEHGVCSKHLLDLESKDLIVALPGQRYQRSPDARQVTIETS
jgi:DNA processing protein